MGLEKGFAAFKVEFTRPAPAGRLALYDAKIEKMCPARRSNDRVLPAFNGGESWELPVPATYVIATDRRITLAHLDIDYRGLLDPETILVGLRTAGT